MCDQDKRFDPISLLLGAANAPQWDLSRLYDYIQDIIEQSLGICIRPTVNQSEDIPPVPSLDKGLENEFPERDSPDDQPSIDTTPHCEATIEELDKTQFSVSQTNNIDSLSDNIDSQSELQNPDISEHIVNPKPKSIDRNIGIQPEAIHTHNMVIIRLELPEGINENDLRILINGDHAVIRWPLGYLEQIVPLPADIQRNKASAVIKDRILEIQIPRDPGSELREISVLK